ncbi:MAG: metallophosphoesterase family protein [Thermoplasmatota archaeon]
MKVRLLVISDIHGCEKAINPIIAAYHNHEPDLLIINGDITNFGTKEDALDILDKLPIPPLGVTGNCDQNKGIAGSYAEVGGINLHLNPIERNGIRFLGLSGSKYSSEELKEFEALAEEGDIFVLHSPPYGFLDETSRGKHIGERGLLPIIERKSPRLVLSGHVHESRGVEDDGETIYLNPGPAMDDNLAVVDVEENKIIPRLI